MSEDEEARTTNIPDTGERRGAKRFAVEPVYAVAFEAFTAAFAGAIASAVAPDCVEAHLSHAGQDYWIAYNPHEAYCKSTKGQRMASGLLYVERKIDDRNGWCVCAMLTADGGKTMTSIDGGPNDGLLVAAFNAQRGA